MKLEEKITKLKEGVEQFVAIPSDCRDEMNHLIRRLDPNRNTFAGPWGNLVEYAGLVSGEYQIQREPDEATTSAYKALTETVKASIPALLKQMYFFGDDRSENLESVA